MWSENHLATRADAILDFKEIKGNNKPFILEMKEKKIHGHTQVDIFNNLFLKKEEKFLSACSWWSLEAVV